MINVVEALPIKAQVSLLFTLPFLWFVLLLISVVKRFYKNSADIITFWTETTKLTGKPLNQ